MRVGIVGSEGAKFTGDTEVKARKIIQELLTRPDVTHVVIGGCHLGGIDIWAVEEAKLLNLFEGYDIKTIEHKPKNLQWSTGYAPRNMRIVEDSDEVHCITLAKLPESYKGMTFKLCYHCGTTEHVKSGGCWTMHKAIKAGKVGKLHVIE